MLNRGAAGNAVPVLRVSAYMTAMMGIVIETE
jgi:hypothetical protein